MTPIAKRAEVKEGLQTAFQESIVQLVRSLGLHKPDETPCGQPISVAEAHALLEIAREPGLTQNGLATRLRLEKSTVSRIAGMLERRGWVRRVRDERDSRFVRLHLTKRGITANANVAESRREKFARIFGALPADQREDVLNALSLLLEVTRET
jgi:DNA-binding MarR family transcriptional regulator